MATEGYKRKLAAILSADVVGYSRLMGEDEAATVKTLEIYKRVIADLIQQHRGRVVDAPGDNILAEFVSVVDAVQCAVAAQKELQARNLEVPESRRMQFRIGINLGDVIEEEDRIYGDGVNIAARLESLAEPGGICISKTAFDHIETKLPLGYEYLGEQTVKNIAKPVPAYKVLMEPRVTVKAPARAKPKEGARRRFRFVALASILLIIAAAAAVFWRYAFPPAAPPVEKASKQQMTLPLPDKPSLAVMPFVNLTGDPSQDFFCDGLSVSLITALSKVPQLFVIAPDSIFRYKGKGVKTKQVSEELGVQYVLEGSVQKAGDRVRVTAQLTDTLTGHPLWSERYDRSLKDIFDLQDEIIMKILTELQVKITEGETVRIQAKGTSNLQAYLKVVEAAGYRNQNNKEANAMARRLSEEAVRLDPNYAMAHTDLSCVLAQQVWMGASESPQETISNAMKEAQRAVELDNSSAEAEAHVGQAFLLMRQYEKAIESGKQAVRIDPNSARAKFILAASLNYSFKSEEAIPVVEQAIRLNPFYPQLYNQVSIAYRETGRYEDGIAAAKKALKLAPNYLLANINLAALYSYAGREAEARAAAAEVMRIDPNFSLTSYAKVHPWKEGPRRDRIMDALRKAGLK